MKNSFLTAWYEAIGAENGSVGVYFARTTKPDLILCDLMMPELDGYGVLSILQKDPNTAGIPFICLTAQNELLGAISTHLTPPVTVTKLNQLLGINAQLSTSGAAS